MAVGGKSTSHCCNCSTNRLKEYALCTGRNMCPMSQRKASTNNRDSNEEYCRNFQTNANGSAGSRI